MPFEITIENPTTLATLPRPLDQFNGQTLAATVFGVKHGHSSFKRRKRTEIAVGIDGVGINLYNVWESHGIAIQQHLCSHQHQGTISEAHHFVFSPTTSNFYVPTLLRSPRTNIITATYNIPTASPIQYLDVLPRQSADPGSVPPPDVVVVHEDGQIRCLKGDLTKELWVTEVGAIASVDNLTTETTSQLQLHVERTFMTDAATARNGILRDREDLQALLVPSPKQGLQQAHHESSLGEEDVRLRMLPVLVIIGRLSNPGGGHERRMVYVFCVRDRPKTNLSDENSPSLLSLASYRLPKLANSPARSLLAPQYSLDSAKGALSVLLADRIVTYDLSSTIPKVSSELYVGQTKFDSFVRLTTSSVLATSSRGIGVYDTKFQSLQASLAYNETSSISPDNKKRKVEYAMEPPYSQIKVVSYLKDLDLVVGLAEGALVGVQVPSSSIHEVQNRKRRKGGLLIDAIGRGLEHPTTGGALLSMNEVLPERVFSGYLPGSLSGGDKKLAGLKDELDNFVRVGDVESFERMVANLLGIERDETPLMEWNKRKNAWERDLAPKHINGTRIANGYHINSTESAIPSSDAYDEAEFAEERPLPTWKTTEADPAFKDVTHVHGEIIRYIIDKMFQWTARPSSVSPLYLEVSNEPSLHLVFYAPNVFRWLVDSQGFHFNLLRRMLQRQQGTTPSTGVMARALINVFADFDPELRLLHSLLLGPVFFGPIQLVEVIRHVLQSLEFVRSRSRSPRPHSNDGEEVHINGNLDAAVSQEENAAEIDIGFALDTLEFGSAIREQTLTLALLRLNAKPTTEVTKALRSQLTIEEITVLIQILRKELAIGGWTSRYLDADPQDSQTGSEDTHEDRSVGLIINLLNCAVDAINVPGWTLNSLEENEDLIAMLKFEVSAALEGIEEATYLRGLLQEILRYNRTLEEASSKPVGSGQGDKGEGMSKPITLLLDGQKEKRLLPVGLKVERDVNRTKVGAGGEVSRRSARDVGMLKSRMVGLYSRERIVL
ncbi:MAG: hypothetical protein M1812_004360 [Candelaria pacifica]|nr:MAG: hypothetical protein M1812_004360 [Candelaria pacifica]